MRRHARASVLTALALALLAVPLERAARAATDVPGGPLLDEVWTAAGSPYLVHGDVTVPAGRLLRIEAGAEVRFDASDAGHGGSDTERVELIVQGALQVDGTAGSPVLLHGASATRGSWAGIAVKGSATEARLRFATVADAVIGVTSVAAAARFDADDVRFENSSSHGLALRAGTVVLDNVTAVGNGDAGVHLAGTAAATLRRCVLRGNSKGAWLDASVEVADRILRLSHCTIRSNTIGVVTDGVGAQDGTIVTDSLITHNVTYGFQHLSGGRSSVTTSDVWSNGTDYRNYTPPLGNLSTNPLYVSNLDLRLTSQSPARFIGSDGVDLGAFPYDGVATPGFYGTLWTDTTLTAAGSPYAMVGTVTIPRNVTLTIEPGVVIDVGPGDVMAAPLQAATGGTLEVIGALVTRGSAAAPVAVRPVGTSLWRGVGVRAGGRIELDGTSIRGGTVRISTSQPSSIVRSRIEGATYGILLEAGALDLRETALIDNSIGLEIVQSGSAQVTGSVFRGNGAGVTWQGYSQQPTTRILRSTIVGNGVGTGIRVTDLPTGSQFVVTDTIVTRNGSGIVRTGQSNPTGVRVTNSDVWDNTTDITGVAPQSSISANPLFVSDTDLRLTSLSPARFGASGGGDIGALPYDGAATVGLQGTLWDDMSLTLAGSPYAMPGDLTVRPGVTLTVAPGVVVNATGDDSMRGGGATTRPELLVDGRLVAVGTPIAPISFAGPATGYWQGIVVRSGAVALLDQVRERRGEIGLVVLTEAAGSVIRRASFDDNRSTGIHVRAGAPVLDAISAIGNGEHGVRVGPGASATLTNCVVSNTRSAVLFESTFYGALVVQNCTLRNSISGLRSSSVGFDTTVDIRNSIITGNTVGVSHQDRSTLTVSYSDVWGNQTNYTDVVPGVGTISTDPRLMSATDARLQAGSPCIDTGTTGPSSDIAGFARPIDGDAVGGPQWDMGAYEFGPSVCGNGALEPGEACDDGNLRSGDGCSADCAVETPPDAGIPDAGVDASPLADAAPDGPDAAPAPDAAPGTVDAAPGTVDAAPGTVDAAPAPDAIEPSVDAGVDMPAPDAGDDPRISDDGQGCSAGDPAAPTAVFSLLLALALRRRRRA